MADKMKIVSLDTLKYYDGKVKTRMENADAQVLADAKTYADTAIATASDNYDPAGTAQTKVEELASGQVADNAAAIAEIIDAETGILKQAKDYADGKDESIADAKKAGTDAQATANKNAEDIVALQGRMTTAEGDIDAVEADMGDVDSLSTTNKTVVGAINEVLAAVGTGGTAAVVTITSDTTTEGALKSYTIKQGTTTVGVIDIPKDMVVESGSVVTNPEGQPEGTYIKLVLANVVEPLYVNVGTLVDIYTAKTGAGQIQVAIDSHTREISATIVAGSVTATEIADNAIVTNKIADANVTKAKLSTEVQASLDKADASVAKETYEAKVEELEQADTDLEGRIAELEANFGDGEGTVESQIASAVAAEKAEREAADEAVEEAASADATEKANKALADAKAHTDAEVAKDRLRLDELEKVDHDHANKAELDLIVSGDKSKWDAATEKANSAVQTIVTGSANGTIAVDGADVAVKGLGSAAYTEASAYEVAGAASDALAEAKGYVDQKVGSVDLSGIATNAEAISDLQEVDTDHTNRISALETKVGEGFEDITTEDIDSMFV